jgi:ubiquinone/menaquinone biosynthesis C-methylase UbiE
MEIEKERLSGNIFLPKWIWLEHNSRYNFASKFAENQVTIDCACGSGAGTTLFSKKAFSVTAFDISETALTEARKKCEQNNVTFELASGTKLPIADEFADTYISLETIEHIQEDENFLKEVSRVLKVGGCFVCSTPNRTVTNPGKKLEQRPANIFHVREYNEKELLNLLKKYFKEVEIFGQNPNFSTKTIAINFLGKFMPFNIATRIHQFIKLLFYFFRKDSYYFVQDKKNGFEYEYLTAVCIK